MQEHIRRAHPDYYIPKLPATEESFRLMIETAPSKKPKKADSGTRSSSVSDIKPPQIYADNQKHRSMKPDVIMTTKLLILYQSASTPQDDHLRFQLLWHWHSSITAESRIMTGMLTIWITSYAMICLLSLMRAHTFRMFFLRLILKRPTVCTITFMGPMTHTVAESHTHPYPRTCHLPSSCGCRCLHRELPARNQCLVCEFPSRGRIL